MTSSPFQSLTIDSLMDSVERVLEQKLSSLSIPRNSYINRVYELEIADSKERIIVKLYRPGRWSKAQIQTEHDFLRILAEKEIQVIAPLSFQGQTLHGHEDILFTIFPKKGGRSSDEFDKEIWEQTGRLLGRIHALGETLDHPDRIIWRPDIATNHHLEAINSARVVPLDFQQSFDRATNLFLKRIEPFFDSAKFILLHGDCHRGNFIYRPGEGQFLVDFDDMCIGPAVQDLWMLLPDIPENCQQELSWFLAGYNMFREFPETEIELVPALRGMRLIHFAAWCAIQSAEPHFKHHFPEWGYTRYWNELIKDLQVIGLED